MATDIDRLLEELRSLSTNDMHRLRQAIDKQLEETQTTVATNGSERIQARAGFAKNWRRFRFTIPQTGFRIGITTNFCTEATGDLRRHRRLVRRLGAERPGSCGCRTIYHICRSIVIGRRARNASKEA
jgi:hypothetical protein